MGEEERIRQWRAQLAEEADSDDEGGGFGLAPPPGGMSGAPKHHDDDLGLNLKEPAPSRLHSVASRAPPPRSGQGPAMGVLRGAQPSGESERELVLQHKLQVLQLKLEACGKRDAREDVKMEKGQGLTNLTFVAIKQSKLDIPSCPT